MPFYGPANHAARDLCQGVLAVAGAAKEGSAKLGC